MLTFFGTVDAARPDTEEISVMEFFNADITAVINYIADVTGYTILLDPNVRGKISLSAKEKITVKQSLDLIESLLQGLGYTMEKNGTLLKVVPIKEQSALKEIYTNSAQIPVGENRLITYVRAISLANGENTLRTIKPFQSKFGNVVYDGASQKLILTDMSENVRNIARLIDQIEVVAPVVEVKETITEVLTLKNMDMDQAMRLLTAGLPDLDIEDSRYPASRRVSPLPGKPGSERPKIQLVPLERKDQILVVGEKSKVVLARKFIEELDGRLARPEAALGYEILTLRSVALETVLDFLSRLLPPGGLITQQKAALPQPSAGLLPKKEASLLKTKGPIEIIVLAGKSTFALVGEDQDRQKVKAVIADMENTVERSQVAPPPVTQATPEIRVITIQYAKSKDILALLQSLRTRGTGNGGSTSQGVSAPLNFVDLIDPAVQFIDHPTANAIIATGPESKLRVVEALVRRLDTRTTQVLIEVKILEVAYTKDMNLGVDFDNLSLRNLIPTLGDLNPGLIPEPLNFAMRSITHGATAPTLNAENPGAFFTFPNSTAIIQALGKIATVNLVSTPNLLTMDNRKASINVIDRKAITKQTVQIADSATAGRDKVITSQEYKDAGLTLTVTPRINDSSNVSLEIDLSVDDFKPTATGYPDISSRKITTEISIKDRTTAILGGIMRDQSSVGNTGLPGAVSVPVLRNILGKTSESKSKSELLVLLTPHIIYDDETLRFLSDKKVMETMLSSMVIPEDLPKTKAAKKEKTPSPPRVPAAIPGGVLVTGPESRPPETLPLATP